MELTRLALDELPTSDFRQPPKHLEEYMRIVGGECDAGPAFEFPEHMPLFAEAVLIEEVERLVGSFNGWTADELPGRSPIMAIVEDGVPLSICFCARASELVAEAGVETAPEYRGRGFAGLATAAWAKAIRASGRTPIYSTSWSNGPSLAVARKLGLVVCASYWNVFAKADWPECARGRSWHSAPCPGGAAPAAEPRYPASGHNMAEVSLQQYTMLAGPSMNDFAGSGEVIHVVKAPAPEGYRSLFDAFVAEGRFDVAVVPSYEIHHDFGRQTTPRRGPYLVRRQGGAPQYLAALGWASRLDIDLVLPPSPDTKVELTTHYFADQWACLIQLLESRLPADASVALMDPRWLWGRGPETEKGPNGVGEHSLAGLLLALSGHRYDGPFYPVVLGFD